MSTPQNITVSLEWAKKLEEAGYPQESAFLENWSYENGKVGVVLPTAEEILRRFEGTVHVAGEILYLRITTDEVIWAVSYEAAFGTSKNIYRTDSSLANAAAQMACYLVGQGLLTFKND